MSSTQIACNEDGVAIDGFDPVAYFEAGKATRGNKGLTHSWSAADWWFANEANRDAFATDPERYAPQYGGHCVLATRLGQQAYASPEAFEIIDDRLYLSRSKGTKFVWKKLPGGIAKTDEKYASIS